MREEISIRLMVGEGYYSFYPCAQGKRMGLNYLHIEDPGSLGAAITHYEEGNNLPAFCINVHSDGLIFVDPDNSFEVYDAHVVLSAREWLMRQARIAKSKL